MTDEPARSQVRIAPLKNGRSSVRRAQLPTVMETTRLAVKPAPKKFEHRVCVFRINGDLFSDEPVLDLVHSGLRTRTPYGVLEKPCSGRVRWLTP